MRRALYPTEKILILLALTLLAPRLSFSEETLALPSWLQPYPGASADLRPTPSMIESSYTSAAQPAEVVEHYRNLFGTAGLPFRPNPDGLGTTIRGEAPECDLLIQIRSRADGALVHVYCSAKAAASSEQPVILKGSTQAPGGRAAGPSTIGPTPSGSHMSIDELMEQHKRKAAEMGIGRQYHDAPAPPLVWPSWLTNVSGAALRAERGVSQSKDAMLRAQYTTTAPMTDIHNFYRDLLNSHEYPARTSLSTGQTLTGVRQNALGYVEGSNFPDGAPGAYSEIHVDFDRSVLNGPITVTLRFTTHEFIAKRGY